MTDLTKLPTWRALGEHHRALLKQNTELSHLFAEDSQRFYKYSTEAAGLVLDYSKNLLTHETTQLLLELAQACDLPQAIEDMFSGQSINTTEQRAAWHVALRGSSSKDVAAKVEASLAKMGEFVEAVQQQRWRGFSGEPISDVVNIGIGGSDLGPAMVSEALAAYSSQSINTHFISNLDPSHLDSCLANLNPASTLFVIASKSFTTMETQQNATRARSWLLAQTNSDAIALHFVAVTNNRQAATELGIAAENIFPLWDWVGGRYSLWSSIGISIALSIGMNGFRALLKGAHNMDSHFRQSPLNENMPVMMALISIWHNGFFGATSQAVIPYSQRLSRFPAFLQQLSMESLGKAVNRQGQTLQLNSGEVIWGEAGSNSQHSFFQLLHQGSHFIPVDFIAIAADENTDKARGSQLHRQLLASCFSQSMALMQGRDLTQVRAELSDAGMQPSEVDNLAPHKVIAGNKPSNTLLLKALNPENLGSLIALYEHKVYVQSVILNINAFDQWGVELGKQLSSQVYRAMVEPDTHSDLDGSTQGLIDTLKRLQN